MQLSLTFHVLGLIFWMCGLLFGTKLIKLAADSSNSTIQALAKRTFAGYLVPGAIITVVTGFFQLMIGGMASYMKQGWMHAKLTLVVVLVWSTIIVALKLLDISQGKSVNPKVGTLYHSIVSAALFIILILTLVKPF